MKRVIGLVFICGAASCVCASAADAPTATHRATAVRTSAKTPASRQAAFLQLAPADEYFGPLKLSILGIRNTIRDLGARYDVNHDIAHQTFSSAQLTERAIHDWEHRYPHDDQVPKAIYLLQRLYVKVLTQESRDRANVTAKWMFADYSSSPQGRQLKKTIALEHLAPIPAATAVPVAAPSYPSEFGSNYKSDFNANASQP
ncbi:MAG: hypothetical protein IAI49_15730, partial [Candidatus Eremiobacteraeota bacterium]|nr:hypothetical protein [Candidatus Eremiobacteraeota bacterium]